MATKETKSLFDSAEAANRYSPVERLTGHFGQMLIKRAGIEEVSDNEDLVILDEACGTGIVSALLMETLNEPAKAKLDLTCADTAQAMVDFVARRIESSGWKNAHAVQSDAMDTNLPSDRYTHILLNFGPMVFPNSAAGLREIHRMLRPGGTVAMSSWRTLGWRPDVKAAFETDPEIPPLPSEAEMLHIFSPDGYWEDAQWVRETVRGAGFVDVDVQEIAHTSSLEGVEDYVNILVGVIGLLASKTWTAEQQEKHVDRAKDALSTYMQRKYRDAPIRWDWIAVLAVAKKPE